MAAVSCQKEMDEPAPRPQEPRSWTVNSSEITCRAGETFRVEGTLVNALGMESVMSGLCTSADKSVVYADGGWDVVALSSGTAVINAEVRFYNHGISHPSSVFSQTVNVTVQPEDRVLARLDVGSKMLTMNRGDSFILSADAVYADGSRKHINPMLLGWSVQDDGAQHITYNRTTGEVKAFQKGGPTELTISFTENGVDISTTLTIEVVD